MSPACARDATRTVGKGTPRGKSVDLIEVPAGVVVAFVPVDPWSLFGAPEARPAILAQAGDL